MATLSPCQCFQAPAFSRRNQFRPRPTGVTNGTLTLNPDGTFTYNPNTHYVGPDSFTYTWSDGLTTGNTATVAIDVYNNAPYAYDAGSIVLDDHEPTGYYRRRSAQLGAMQSFSVLHDREPTGSVYGYDPDGDAITMPIVSSPSVFSAQLISAPTNGTVELNADGRFIYTPAAGYTGTDAFVFGFTGGIALGLAMAWITVHNTAPLPV
jgi:hypothetical protein